MCYLFPYSVCFMQKALNFFMFLFRAWRDSTLTQTALFEGLLLHFLVWYHFILFHLQISTRVFIVWAFQEMDDVNNPRMFSMHTRKGYSRETQILAIEASEPTFSTKKFVKTEPGNTSSFEMTTKLLEAKSSGFKPRFNVITLSFVTITLYFLLVLQFACWHLLISNLFS